MTVGIATATPEMPVKDAATLMLGKGISALPVLDGEDRLLGIISEDDLVRCAKTDTEINNSWWLGLFTSSQTLQERFVKSHGQHVEDVTTRNPVVVDVIWPLIEALNPSADVAALANVDVDHSDIAPVATITIKCRGKPAFIDRRIPETIVEARAEDVDPMSDPEPDVERVQHAEWLIVIGVCTHLGCIPLRQSGTGPTGQWEGWFCPYYGSHCDASGRTRKGPTPQNLVVPPYQFLSSTQDRIRRGGEVEKPMEKPS